MNYSTIQKCVLQYKSGQNKQEALLEILRQYEPVIKNLINGLSFELRRDFEQYYILEMIKTIERYDVNKNVQFNTYWFYRCLGLKKDFYSQTHSIIHHEKSEKYGLIAKNFIHEKTEIDNEKLNNFLLDFSKILNKEEQLIYYGLVHGRIKKIIPKVLPVLNKIKQYLRVEA